MQFLRGDLRAVDLTPSEADLAAFAREAPALAWDAHRGAGDRPPAELGRDEARCRAEGCGWVVRCFAAARHPVPAGTPGAEGRETPGDRRAAAGASDAAREGVSSGAEAREGFSSCLAPGEVSTLRPAPAGPT